MTASSQKPLDGGALKILAIAAMAIDHVGAFLFPSVMLLRYIGRLTFPIMAFFVYEGWRHTRDVKRYGLRLLAFALVSEIPYNLAYVGRIWYADHQNIGFTLLLGLLALELTRHGVPGWAGSVGVCLLGDILRVDYGTGGVASILLFAVFVQFRLPPVLSVAAGTLLLTYDQWLAYWPLIQWGDPASYRFIPPQSYALLAMVPLALYNGRRGRAPGWLFYAFYPGHLLLLHLFRGPLTALLEPLLYR